MTRRLLLVAAFAAATAANSFGDGDDSKQAVKRGSSSKSTANDEVSVLLNSVKRTSGGPRLPIHEAISAIQNQLGDKETAKSAAKKLLDRRTEFEIDPVLEKRLAAMIA